MVWLWCFLQLAGVNIREPEMLERYESKYGKAVNTLAQTSQKGTEHKAGH